MQTKKIDQQATARQQYAALAKHYGQIGNAAILAALIHRKPANSNVAKTR